MRYKGGSVYYRLPVLLRNLPVNNYSSSLNKEQGIMAVNQPDGWTKSVTKQISCKKRLLTSMRLLPLTLSNSYHNDT